MISKDQIIQLISVQNHSLFLLNPGWLIGIPRSSTIKKIPNILVNKIPQLIINQPGFSSHCSTLPRKNLGGARFTAAGRFAKALGAYTWGEELTCMYTYIAYIILYILI